MPTGSPRLPKTIDLIETLSPEHVRQLHGLYQQEWWTKARNLDETSRLVAGSTLNFGLVDRIDQSLVGYARVLTDFTIKALVLDVIVRSDRRGKRLGAVLMESILSHPTLTLVKHFELYCRPEMEAFYKAWGFTAELGELRFMRRG